MKPGNLFAYDAEVWRKMTATCVEAMEESFSELKARQENRIRRSKRSAEVTSAIIRTIFSDKEKLLTASKNPQEVLNNMDLTIKTSFPLKGSRSFKPSEIEPRMDVLGPPYLNIVWHAQDQKDNGAASVHALAEDATFGFSLSASGGSASAGAGFLIPVTPASPIQWQIQIRPFCPFSYQFDDSSEFWTAHSDVSFGIKVFSFDINGQDGRTDQDFEYPAVMDGTGWQEEHTNPSFDDFDFDNAFEFDRMMPFFTVEPNRSYLATVFCTGTCDAGSGDGFASSANVFVNATMPLVVIAKQ